MSTITEKGSGARRITRLKRKMHLKTCGNRKTIRLILSIRTGYALTGELTIFAEYYRTDNHSNFPRYDYTSNQFMGGLEKTF